MEIFQSIYPLIDDEFVKSTFYKTKGHPEYISSIINQPKVNWEQVSSLRIDSRDEYYKALYISLSSDEKKFLHYLSVFKEPVRIDSLLYLLKDLNEINQIITNLRIQGLVLFEEDNISMRHSLFSDFIQTHVRSQEIAPFHKKCAIYFLELDYPKRAINHFVEAIKILRNDIKIDEVLSLADKIVKDYLQDTLYSSALKLTYTIINLLEDKFPNMVLELSEWYNKAVNGNYYLNHFDKAILFSNKSLGILEKLEKDSADYYFFKITSLFGLITNYPHLNKLEEAESVLTQVQTMISEGKKKFPIEINWESLDPMIDFESFKLKLRDTVIQIDDYDYQKINKVVRENSSDVTCACFLTQS